MNYSTFEMPDLNVKRLKTDLILNYKRLGVGGIVEICAIAHSELLGKIKNDTYAYLLLLPNVLALLLFLALRD